MNSLTSLSSQNVPEVESPHLPLQTLQDTVHSLLFSLGERQNVEHPTEHAKIFQNSQHYLLSHRTTLPQHVLVAAKNYQENPFFAFLKAAYHTSVSAFHFLMSAIFTQLARFIPLFAKQKEKNEELQLEVILRTLKHSQLISVKEELEILDAFSKNNSEMLNRLATSLIGSIVQDPIDSQRIIKLFKEKQYLQAFRYLHTLTLLHTLTQSAEEWKDLVSLSENQELVTFVGAVKETGQVEPLHELLMKISQKLLTKQWLEKELNHNSYSHIQDLNRQKEILLKAIQKDDLASFKSELIKLLQQADTQKRSPLEAYYLNECVVSLQNPELHPFQAISYHFTQDKFLNSWTRNIETLLKQAKEVEISSNQEDIDRLTSIAEASIKAYGLFGKLLEREEKNILSRTQFAHTYGKTVEVWRKINEELTQKKPVDARHAEHTHSLCSCLYGRHIQRKAPHIKWKGISDKHLSLGSIERLPEDTARKEAKSVLFMTCSYGNGHMSTTDALINYTRQNTPENPYRYHVRSLNVPLEVLLPLDPIFNTLGKVWSYLNTDFIYNKFMSLDRCDLIALMRKLGGGAPSEEAKNKNKALIREAILKERPDLVVITYGFNAMPILEVCKELGIPVAGVNTDTDISGYTGIDLPKHFKLTTYSKCEKILNTFELGNEFRDTRLVETGPPIRSEFLRPYPALRLAEIRQKYKIRDDEHVVFFSSGGLGVWSKIPETIASWKTPNKKVRFIVVTGKNTEFKEHLENNVLPHIANKEMMKMDVLGFTKAEDMADLMHIAHVVIGKPGGLTTAEVIHSGARFIGDQTGFRLDWERLNNEVAIDAGIGSKIEKLDELIPTLESELGKEKRKTDLFPQDAPYSTKYLELFASLIQDAEKDPETHVTRRRWEKGQDTHAKISSLRQQLPILV